MRLILVLAVWFAVADCLSIRRGFPGFGRAMASKRSASFQPPAPKVTFYTQNLDHLNPENSEKTYQERILTYDGYWGNGTETHFKSETCPGPIFFYTGNESPVTDYYNSDGFVFYLAQRHGAKVIFAEHRYFGESLPFGNESFTDENVGYLSPEQALADYAVYLTEVNEKLNCPVIAFGGSYGGMLTAWFRMKYPNIVYGGLAASAPFAFYGTGVSEYAYMDAAQDSYAQAAPNCDVYLGEVLQAILKASQTQEGLSMLSSVFPTCSPLKTVEDGENLLGWVQNALIYMVELDYDTNSDYGIKFPAWPLNRTCSDLISKWSQGPLPAIAYAIQNYYNSTGDKHCVDMERDQPDFATSPGWGYIACTEAYFPMAQRGIWIPHTVPDLAADAAACKEEWGVTLRPNWSRIHWGGFKSFSVASNIIFSNGLVDPWHALGQLTSPSKDSIAILIPTGGHHADLRAPDPADTTYITDARNKEEAIILGWLKDFFTANK